MAWSLRLRSFTTRTYVPYLVKTSPGAPPVREPDLSSPIPPDGTYTVDVTGFNPAFAPQPFEVPGSIGQANTFTIQLALSDSPPIILVVTYRSLVPPGEEGTDPSNQPQKVAEFPFPNLTEGAYRLRVGAALQTFDLEADSGQPAGGKSGCLFWPLATLLPWLSGSPFA